MPPIRPELLDELLKDYKKPDDLLGQDGLLQQLTKALVERALDGELTHHLGYEKNDAAGDNSGNSRNGTTPKTTLAAMLGHSKIQMVLRYAHPSEEHQAAAMKKTVAVCPVQKGDTERATPAISAS
jgi:hypothetical protein